MPGYLVFVDSFDFEDDRSRAVVTTGDHRVFFLHPSFHDGAALEASVNVSGDGIPGFGAVGNPRTAGRRVPIAVGGHQGIEPMRQKESFFFGPFEDVLVADVVAGTGTGFWVGTVLLLEFGV